MRYLIILVLTFAGCFSSTGGASTDGAPADDAVVTETVDLIGFDTIPTALPDLSGTDGSLPSPLNIVGTFHAGAVEGSANGMAVRLRFNWNSAVAGSANGIAVRGSFR